MFDNAKHREVAVGERVYYAQAERECASLWPEKTAEDLNQLLQSPLATEERSRESFFAMEANERFAHNKRMRRYEQVRTTRHERPTQYAQH